MALTQSMYCKYFFSKESLNHLLGDYVLGRGLPRWLSGTESTWRSRRCSRHGFDPWARKMPWRRKWQPTPAPTQYSCLENPMDTGAWWASVRGVAKESDTTVRLSTTTTTTKMRTHFLSTPPELKSFPNPPLCLKAGSVPRDAESVS